MKKIITLIISGGELNLDFAKTFIESNNINNIIAVDKGLESLDKLKILPNYIVGDFDSIDKEVFSKYDNGNIKIIKLNPEKDYTDTHTALKLAIDLKSSSVYILGAMGKRIDHALANIHILREALDSNIECKILDLNNEIQLITTGKYEVQNSEYKYVSLIPLTTKVEGVTLNGFKYPLNNAILEIGCSIGVSNELVDTTATIEIKFGVLIMIKSKD